MARECKLTSPMENKAIVEVQKQRKGWKKKEVVKQKDQRFPKYKRTFYGYCHCCQKLGHKATDCRINRKDKDLKRQINRISVSRVPHGKMWRRKLDYKYSHETNIPRINEVSEDDSAVDKNDIHYDENKDEDVKEYTNGDDEEEYNDDGGTEKECIFQKSLMTQKRTLKLALEGFIYSGGVSLQE